MKIEITTIRPEYVNDVIHVDAYARIPPWAGQGTCQHCKYDFDDNDGCIVMISSGELFYFHEKCFDMKLAK